ncbi:hypothetical protein ACFQ9R_22890 [Nocardia sp. NPDC056541]|uniref:hypothetical protein n=1 Tax=Nocardia sp. NPDC056541 TaxID=3345860 RepID=UPI00366BEA62
MAAIRLRNGSETTLEVRIEPWGEDYWMRPGDEFTIGYDEADHDEKMMGGPHFDVTFHGDWYEVWVGSSDMKLRMHDQSGAELEHGHQRPSDPA